MAQKVISFHYTLTDPAGRKLDSSDGRAPMTFLEGGHQIIPGLESELVKLKAGEKKQVTVKAADAYGKMKPEMIVEVPREKLPAKEIKVGDRFRAGPDQHAPAVIVTKVSEKTVTIDGNHPLAGLDLTFAVEITASRDATADELAHGHAHGPEGHNH